MKAGLACQNSLCAVSTRQYLTPKDITKENGKTKKEKQTTCILLLYRHVCCNGSYAPCFSGSLFCVMLENIFK